MAVLVGLVCAIALAGAERASALGQLTYSACTSYDGTNGLCTTTPGPTLVGPAGAVISPDGSSAYVTADTGNAIGVYDRGAQGQLTYASCASSTGDGGICADLPGTLLTRPDSVAISPDGASVYVGALGMIAVFDRASGGQLTYNGCVSDDGSTGLCADLPGTPLGLPDNIAVSPDGRSLYAAAAYHGVTVLDRDSSGQLTYSGCVSNDSSNLLCGDVPGNPFEIYAALAISPDGQNVYVSGGAANGVVVFDRAAGGQLTYAGCVSNDGSNLLCADVPGTPMDLPAGMSIAPDGSSVYVTGVRADTITVLDRAAGGQLTYAGCVSDSSSGGFCADAPGTPLDGALRVATSPDGATVYVAAFLSDTITVLDRAAGGQLTYASCVSDSGSGGVCADAPGTPLNDPFSIAISPDGTSVYVPDVGSGMLTQLIRKTAPQTTIDAGPAQDATISVGIATFGFSADQAGAVFECSLDGAVFTACSTPSQIRPLTNGRHEFAVRAVTGGDADPTPAIRRFTVAVTPVDTTAPRVDVTRGPSGKIRSIRRSRKVTFAFASNEPGSTFACELDGNPVAPCASPEVLRVPLGRHLFTVRATDTGGNTSGEARRSFRVVRRAKRGF